MKNEYFIIGEVLYIISYSKGVKHEIRADANDLERLNSFGSWSVSAHPRSKGLVATAFYRNGEKKSRVYMHRVLMDATPDKQVDHINHDTLDNRKQNLRLLTDSENKQNRSLIPSHNTSGVRGVMWSKQKQKWHVTMVIDGKRMHGGYFSNLLEAEEKAKMMRAMYAPMSPEGMANPEMHKPLEYFNNEIRSNNKTGVSGVDFMSSRNKWRARYKENHLGLFDSIEEAAEAINKVRENINQ